MGLQNIKQCRFSESVDTVVYSSIVSEVYQVWAYTGNPTEYQGPLYVWPKVTFYQYIIQCVPYIQAQFNQILFN